MAEVAHEKIEVAVVVEIPQHEPIVWAEPATRTLLQRPQTRRTVVAP